MGTRTMTLTEACQELGVPRGTAAKWITRGHISPRRVGPLYVLGTRDLAVLEALRDSRPEPSQKPERYVEIDDPGETHRTVPIAAAEVGRSARTIWRWLASGKIQGYRWGEVRLVCLDELRRVAAG